MTLLASWYPIFVLNFEFEMSGPKGRVVGCGGGLGMLAAKGSQVANMNRKIMAQE